LKKSCKCSKVKYVDDARDLRDNNLITFCYIPLVTPTLLSTLMIYWTANIHNSDCLIIGVWFSTKYNSRFHCNSTTTVFHFTIINMSPIFWTNKLFFRIFFICTLGTENICCWLYIDFAFPTFPLMQVSWVTFGNLLILILTSMRFTNAGTG
jgi:hypothetical protein